MATRMVQEGSNKRTFRAPDYATFGAPPLVIARRTITPEQTTYELTAPAGTLLSALAR